MSESALKCVITVTAGVVPDVPESECSRTWNITAEDMKHPPRFIDACGAAMNYALSLQNPGRLNWVRHDWLWL